MKKEFFHYKYDLSAKGVASEQIINKLYGIGFNKFVVFFKKTRRK